MMKKLVKVQLINWHGFTNENFEILNNTLLTGENASGKSTLLDAIQYVLTAGKAKFNSAANGNARRTLEGYMRCKIGREGKEYLREGDVTSYVVLEYYDEKTLRNQLIGVILDLPSGGQVKANFFQILDKQIKDIMLIKNNHVLNRREFRDWLSDEAMVVHFEDTKNRAAKLLANALGVKEKYFELVPRALAFEAIDKVYKFIFDFLLKEDDVDISQLRDSIRHYKQLYIIFEEQQRQCEVLAKIDETFSEYEKNALEKEAYYFAKEDIAVKHLEFNIEKAREIVKRNTSLLQNVEQALLEKEKQLVRKNEQIRDIENALSSNESYILKQKLDIQLQRIKEQKAEITTSYNTVVENLDQEAKIMSKLKIQNAFVEYITNRDLTSEKTTEFLLDIKNYVFENNNTSQRKLSDIENNVKNKIDEHNRMVEKHDILSKNKFYYRRETYELIRVLKEELFKRYNQHVDVKPLCEYLEVKDESWRNAIEGYLNTQRFDLIIDPEYFSFALKIYEEHKNRNGIFGVGIVDVAKLKKYETMNEDSLASQVEAKNTYARWYTNMLLNKVQCVEHVEQLQNYQCAITKTVMLYKNYTVRSLNPKVYQVPFIGLQALKLQKEELEKQLQDKKDEITQLRQEISTAKNRLELLQASKAEILLSQVSIIDTWQQIIKEYQEKEKQLSELTLNPTIISLGLEKDKELSIQVILNNEKTELLQKQFSYSNIITENNDFLDKNSGNLLIFKEQIMQKEQDSLELLQLKEDIVIEYRKKYYRDFIAIEKKLDSKIKEVENQLRDQENEIIFKMKDYNYKFNVGFEEKISAIKVYRDRYYKLRDIDLVDKKDKTRMARLKCEESFQETFISVLKEKIQLAIDNIRILNKGLAKRDFNGERYEFIVGASKQKEYRKYYEIIQLNQSYEADNLFAATLSQENRSIMDELFEKISLSSDETMSEKALQDFTDYRNYLDYDIKITYSNGDYSFFSKVNKEKSGGETQTPFYVVIAASFEQAIRNGAEEDYGCVVMFDEAFNNMDESRIQEMLKFYNELNIQIIVAVPPSRISAIVPYVNTTLLVVKQDNKSFVEPFTNEEEI